MNQKEVIDLSRERKGEVAEGSDSEIQLVTFGLGKEMFAVNVEKVREIGKVERITKVPKMPTFIEGVMNLRGQITTIIDLHRRFGISGKREHTDQSRIIVAEIGDIQVGIIVDSVDDVITVGSASLSPPPKSLSSEAESRFLTGICKQKDSLIMLVDLNQIIDDQEMNQINELNPGHNEDA
jgi:purine-binding chemotaxis protein CheW